MVAAALIKRFMMLRKGGGVGQRGAELGGIHDLACFPKHRDGKYDQSGEEFQAEGEPDLIGIGKVHRLVAVLNQMGSTTGEVTLALEGGDGGHSIEGLVDLKLEGRAHTGFRSL